VIALPDHMGIMVYLQLMWSMWVVLLPFATLAIYGFELAVPGCLIYAFLYQYVYMYFAKLLEEEVYPINSPLLFPREI
jgi:hypothetical protein